jgi:TorA maturation chaperone TorD
MTPAPVPGPDEAPALAPEEALRAEIYGLLAHVFAAAPSAAVLEAVAGASADLGAPGEPLHEAWRALRRAAGAADAAALEVEHAELFVGTGRAKVSIYASHYLSETWKEHTLVGLRDELDGLGLARQAGVTQPEDHLSALLEVMRHLAQRGTGEAALAHQQRFFERYIGPWLEQFGAALAQVGGTPFYGAAAEMLLAFGDLERQAFRLAE